MALLPLSFLTDIRTILSAARGKAFQVINFAMVEAYWHIGAKIVDEEQNGNNRAEYGKALIKELSVHLTNDFGRGFTPSNLAYMRQFYLTFQNFHALRGELTWTHYRILLKVQNDNAREFYLKEAVEQNWSTRDLERQVNSFYYERLLASQDRLPVITEAARSAGRMAPEDIIKDPYVLEFLGLKENTALLERELEAALIEKLQAFLLELGKGFSFVARQQRITADGDHFYIDLVFYNFFLKCFVLIDLKVGKLTHQDIGQMDFYVRYYEDNRKIEGDNPTIGIILCSEKNETIVKYSVLENSRRLFASRYKLYLPSEEELRAELEREKRIIEQERRLTGEDMMTDEVPPT